jgi:hypothetical protein
MRWAARFVRSVVIAPFASKLTMVAFDETAAGAAAWALAIGSGCCALVVALSAIVAAATGSKRKFGMII